MIRASRVEGGLRLRGREMGGVIDLAHASQLEPRVPSGADGKATCGCAAEL